MLNSDEEIIQFLKDKIQVFSEKIFEIQQVWQLLTNFKLEIEYLQKIEQENKISLIPPQQLEELKMQIEQKRQFLVR